MHLQPGKSIFTPLALLLSLAFGVACTPKVTAPTSEQVQVAKPAKVVVKKLRVAEMKPEDKQIHDWSLQLKKSHEIFREVWAHIWEDRMQSPMSVFFEIERLMHSHKNSHDGRFRAQVLECPKRATEIEILRKGEGIQGAVFYKLDCNAQGHIGAKNEMARVQKQGSTDVWTFYAEHMARAAGSSMAFLKEKVTCTNYLDARHRLTGLNCKNLGQNRDSETHLVFSQFQYQKNGDTMVQVEGKKFKLLTTAVCDNDKFCTQLRVPLVGAIEVFEDTVSEAVRQERRQAQLEKDRAEEARVAIEAHKKFVKETAAKAQNVAQPGVRGQGPLVPGSGSAVPGSGPVVPGQVASSGPPANYDPQQATSEPQFGEPVRPVGADGIAHEPVMEFNHSGQQPHDSRHASPDLQYAAEPTAPPRPPEREEDYRARLGQPEGFVPNIPQEASVPTER